jgi:hypothetical protein
MGDSLASGNSAVDLALLPSYWHEAPRRWGHQLHSLCSYFAMFPPQLARVFIDWLSEPGDVVYDPFSGRGTVSLEALLLGRVGLASDANPLAQVLSQAKTTIPSRIQLEARLTELETSGRRSRRKLDKEPADIRMLYSDGTLRQLVFLKHALDRTDPTDAFLIATILGLLHANHSKTGATRGFSISMPNTFAMSPHYVRKYIKEHKLVRPEVDVFALVRARLDGLDLPNETKTAGAAWLQDATRAPAWPSQQRARLVITSPPYLHVIKYVKYYWVRLWFLGESPRSVDDQLMSSSSLTRYVEFMTKVCTQLAPVVEDDGYVCLVIGDVRHGNDHLNLAESVWEQAIKPLGWHLHGIVADEIPERHKVSRIWKNNTGRATKTDRILLLSPSVTSLPGFSEPTWDKPTFSKGAAA